MSALKRQEKSKKLDITKEISTYVACDLKEKLLLEQLNLPTNQAKKEFIEASIKQQQRSKQLICKAVSKHTLKTGETHESTPNPLVLKELQTKLLTELNLLAHGLKENNPEPNKPKENYFSNISILANTGIQTNSKNSELKSLGSNNNDICNFLKKHGILEEEELDNLKNSAHNQRCQEIRKLLLHIENIQNALDTFGKSVTKLVRMDTMKLNDSKDTPTIPSPRKHPELSSKSDTTQPEDPPIQRSPTFLHKEDLEGIAYKENKPSEPSAPFARTPTSLDSPYDINLEKGAEQDANTTYSSEEKPPVTPTQTVIQPQNDIAISSSIPPTLTVESSEIEKTSDPDFTNKIPNSATIKNVDSGIVESVVPSPAHSPNKEPDLIRQTTTKLPDKKNSPPKLESNLATMDEQKPVIIHPPIKPSDTKQKIDTKTLTLRQLDSASPIKQNSRTETVELPPNPLVMTSRFSRAILAAKNFFFPTKEKSNPTVAPTTIDTKRHSLLEKESNSKTQPKGSSYFNLFGLPNSDKKRNGYPELKPKNLKHEGTIKTGEGFAPASNSNRKESLAYRALIALGGIFPSPLRSAAPKPKQHDANKQSNQIERQETIKMPHN